MSKLKLLQQIFEVKLDAESAERYKEQERLERQIRNLANSLGKIVQYDGDVSDFNADAPSRRKP